MGKYLDIARKFEARRAEAGISAQRPATPPVRPVSPVYEAAPWPCEHCGNPAHIEAVELSQDGQRMLTYWHCEPCQTWGVTPDTIKQPPVWVSKKQQ